jgi:hypothetical protein
MYSFGNHLTIWQWETKAELQNVHCRQLESQVNNANIMSDTVHCSRCNVYLITWRFRSSIYCVLFSEGILFRWFATGWRSGDRMPVGARFSAPVQTDTGAHPASLQWVTDPLPGGKEAGEWRWPLTPPSAKVKERVELYLYSPCGRSCHVSGWTVLLPCSSRTRSGPFRRNFSWHSWVPQAEIHGSTWIRTRSLHAISLPLFSHGATAHSGTGPPHCRGFTIT